MNIKSDIILKRKEHLGLTKHDTKKIFDTILDVYKSMMIEAPRQIIDYEIDIVLCNMNGYNQLGKIKEINEVYGDKNLYIDFNNSQFIKKEIKESGNIVIKKDKDLIFKNISELKKIKDISFSLGELINLCKEKDCSISIYEKCYLYENIIVTIMPFEKYKIHNSITEYLNTLKNNS